jgi:glycosyltransferase involved in cell wall biosynthesis
MVTSIAQPMRIVVLAPRYEAPREAMRVTLDCVLNDPGCAGVIDVFGPHDEVLEALHRGRLRWHDRQEDLGQALSVLRPGAFADIAWIRAGLMASRNWASVLQALLHQDDRTGAAGPLDLDMPWCSPLPERLLKSWRTAGPPRAIMQALAEWLSNHASHEAVQLGMAHGGCGVLRGRMAALLSAQHASLRAPDSWASLMSREGCLPVFSRRVLVFDTRSATNVGSPSGSSLLAAFDMWRHSHPLTALRAAVEQHWPDLANKVGHSASHHPETSLAESQTPAGPGAAGVRRAVRLHVAHSWGGGLSKWVRDFAQTDQAKGHGQGLVLRSVGVFGAFGQRLSLYAGDEEVMPLRFWELGVPIHATATAHLQVQQILREIIEEFQVDHVVVSSLIGHSLDVLRTGLPTVVVAHDHYPFCVTLYAEFEGECRSCSRERLADCIQRNPAHRFFGGVQTDDWMDLRQAFIDAVVAHHTPIVAPAPSVALRWQAMMPGLSPAQFRVIAHGLNLPETPAFSPPDEGPLRVVVLGRLTQEKGANLLSEMIKPLRGFAELILVGCGERIDPAFQGSGIQTIPNFDNTALPSILSQARPHVGLLMSTVPETFSYALSELWHAGIPVVATDSGALADRIAHGVTGFIAPARAEALLDQLRELDGRRDQLATMRGHLLRAPSRGLEEMVLEYLELLPAPAPRTGIAASSAQAHAASILSAALDRSHEQAALARTLVVNPEVTWMQALRGFWRFTCLKASQSPRLPTLLKRLAARLL